MRIIKIENAYYIIKSKRSPGQVMSLNWKSTPSGFITMGKSNINLPEELKEKQLRIKIELE